MDEERLVNRGNIPLQMERWRTREKSFDCHLHSLGKRVIESKFADTQRGGVIVPMAPRISKILKWRASVSLPLLKAKLFLLATLFLSLEIL